MVVRESRAIKNDYDPVSRTLVRSIVGIGLQDGWLHREMHAQSGAELIWIEPQEVAHSEGTLLQEPPSETHNNLHELPLGVEPSNPASAPELSAAPAPNKSHQDSISTASKDQSRNFRETVRGQMEMILRDEEIGSPASVRPLMFAAVREALTTEEPGRLTGADLWSRVAQITERMSEGTTQKYNWERTTECFLNMLFGAGVFRGPDNAPIPLTFARWSTKVTGFTCDDGDLEVQGQAYLVLRIITRRGGFAAKEEFFDLSFTIFQQGPASGPSILNIKTQTARLLTFLQFFKQLSEVVDGRIAPLNITTSQVAPLE